MKVTTKQRIINAAIKLFNKNGFAAVSLFEIAGSLGMTRGNLTYHFKNKDQLLKAIADEMWRKLLVERNKSRQLPSFENLHNEVQLYYRFQKKYAFIFLDYHVLNHRAIRAQFRQMTEASIKDNMAAIAFAISSGNMKPEPYKGIYQNIAFNTWMLTFFWLAQQIIRGEKTGQDGEAMIWSMLLPHFTEKGIKAFTGFFGETYLEELGDSFDTNIENYIAF
ncbi:MAG: TetR/AcrR family transcriptional regulator [Bacteroidota bacterium]